MTRAERELAALRGAVLAAPDSLDEVRSRGMRWRRRQQRRFAALGLGIAAIGAIGMVTVLEPATTTPSVVSGTPQQGENYLVIGSDARTFVSNSSDEETLDATGNGLGQRADIIMVVHVDAAAKKAVVVSLPRDLWLDVPGVGMAKISSSFNRGPGAVLATIEQNFDISIDHYIEVDFKGFRKVVSEVGRIPVYFPYPARDHDAGLSIEAAGCVPLNAREALAYVRSRHLEYYAAASDQWLQADTIADIGRIGRQQDFLRRLASAVRRKVDDPLAMNEIVDSLVEHLKIDTRLTKGDLLGLADLFHAIDAKDQESLEFATFPSTAGTVDDMAVLFPLDEEWLAARLSSDVDTTTTTAPSVLREADSPFGPPARNTARCR